MYMFWSILMLHSFMARKIENLLKMQQTKLKKKRFLISTPLRDVVLVGCMYKSVRVIIEGRDMEVNLMPLELHDFDLILGMDWLSTHKVQMDCFVNMVTLQGVDEKKVIFKGERKVISSCVISGMITRKLMRKGCVAYLAYIIYFKKDRVELKNLPIMREFPKELLRLPPNREVKVLIDILLGNFLIAHASYRMTPT